MNFTRGAITYKFSAKTWIRFTLVEKLQHWWRCVTKACQHWDSPDVTDVWFQLSVVLFDPDYIYKTSILKIVLLVVLRTDLTKHKFRLFTNWHCDVGIYISVHTYINTNDRAVKLARVTQGENSLCFWCGHNITGKCQRYERLKVGAKHATYLSYCFWLQEPTQSLLVLHRLRKWRQSGLTLFLMETLPQPLGNFYVCAKTFYFGLLHQRGPEQSRKRYTPEAQGGISTDCPDPSSDLEAVSVAFVVLFHCLFCRSVCWTWH